MKKGGKRERNEEGSSRGGKELPVPLTQSYTHFQHRQTQTHTHTNLHTDGIIRRPELLNTTLIKIQLTKNISILIFDTFSCNI